MYSILFFVLLYAVRFILKSPGSIPPKPSTKISTTQCINLFPTAGVSMSALATSQLVATHAGLGVPDASMFRRGGVQGLRAAARASAAAGDALSMRTSACPAPRQQPAARRGGRGGRFPSLVVCATAGMNVVFVGAEMAPWSKTGGLGDVLGGLPPAMAVSTDAFDRRLPVAWIQCSWCMYVTCVGVMHAGEWAPCHGRLSPLRPVQGRLGHQRRVRGTDTEIDHTPSDPVSVHGSRSQGCLNLLLSLL